MLKAPVSKALVHLLLCNSKELSGKTHSMKIMSGWSTNVWEIVHFASRMIRSTQMSSTTCPCALMVNTNGLVYLEVVDTGFNAQVSHPSCVRTKNVMEARIIAVKKIADVQDLSHLGGHVYAMCRVCPHLCPHLGQKFMRPDLRPHRVTACLRPHRVTALRALGSTISWSAPKVRLH